MALIEVKYLLKTYKIIQKKKGLKGYLKNLVKLKAKEFKAVKDRDC